MTQEECRGQFFDCIAEIERRLDTRLKDTAKEAAEKAVTRTMLILGVDVGDPLKAQRDFMIMHEIGLIAMDPEFRKDLEHIRVWRLRIDAITAKSIAVIVGTLLAGSLAALWVGLKVMLSRKD